MSAPPIVTAIVFHHRFVKGWPKPRDPKKAAKWFDDHERCFKAPAGEFLPQRYFEDEGAEITGTDAHFVAYDADIERRHTISLYQDPANKELIAPANVRMTLAVFDVDDPVAHEQHTPARDEWIEGEQPKLQALIDAHPDPFIYQTRGGYRVVYVLPKPRPIRSQTDDDLWTAYYESWVRYLARRFDVRADRSCADWTRFYRAPFVLRDGEPQTPHTFGDPSALGVWAPKLEAADRVTPKKAGEAYGAVEPVPIADPSNAYGQARLESAVRYLERAPLSIRGETGRNTMFSVCCYLVRRLRLPIELATDAIDVIYNPRLDAAGTSTWSRDEAGPHGMSIVERLEKARDTGTIPPGDVSSEEEWTKLQGILSRKSA